jgi:tRNA modification GTPase
MDTFERVLADLARACCGPQDDNVFMLSMRQRDLLRRALEALERAARGAAEGALAELIVEDVRVAHDALGEVTGAITSEDVLDALFAQFCIGK